MYGHLWRLTWHINNCSFSSLYHAFAYYLHEMEKKNLCEYLNISSVILL